MNHKHHLLNNYLLIKLFTLSIYIIQQANSAKRHMKFKKSFLIYSSHLSQFDFIGQAQKSIKQFPYIVIVGNGGIWFGTTFPYKVIAGNRGIWFSTISGYCRCHLIIWACPLPCFYIINPKHLVHMSNLWCIWSK